MESSSNSFRANLTRHQPFAAYYQSNYDTSESYQRSRYLPITKDNFAASQRRDYGNWDRIKYGSRVNTTNRKEGKYRNTRPSLSKRTSRGPMTSIASIRNKAKMSGVYGIKSSTLKNRRSIAKNSVQRTAQTTQARVSSALRADAASRNIAKKGDRLYKADNVVLGNKRDQSLGTISPPSLPCGRMKQEFRKDLCSASVCVSGGDSDIAPGTRTSGDQVEPDCNDMAVMDGAICKRGNAKDIRANGRSLFMGSSNSSAKKVVDSEILISKLEQKDAKHIGLDNASKGIKGRRVGSQIVEYTKRLPSIAVSDDPMRDTYSSTGGYSKFLYVRKEKPENRSFGVQIDEDTEGVSLPKTLGTQPDIHGSHCESHIWRSSAETNCNPDDSLVKLNKTLQRDNLASLTTSKSMERTRNASRRSDARSETLKFPNRYHVDISSLPHLMDVKLEMKSFKSLLTNENNMGATSVHHQSSGDTVVKLSSSPEGNDTTEMQRIDSSSKLEESQQVVNDTTQCTFSRQRLINSPFEGECGPMQSPGRDSINQFEAGVNDR